MQDQQVLLTVESPTPYLNILDTIPVSIVITLVPDTIVISIFLPRVGCQKAIVLLAVLVVIHAGKSLVRIAVYVCVRPTHVPVPCPAHVTLA